MTAKLAALQREKPNQRIRQSPAESTTAEVSTRKGQLSVAGQQARARQVHVKPAPKSHARTPRVTGPRCNFRVLEDGSYRSQRGRYN
eukprot:scaffold64678_cov15-Prasinocladus_malaysianus.AAC.1